jgi:DHA2 family multidrug resistance protein-like MFS transporter
VSLITLALFFWRQSKAKRPLINLGFARARTYWVAFVAGAITFGSLIGAMFIGQQFMQNVLGYSALDSALVVLPSAILTAVFSQVAGEVVEKTGSRLSFALGLFATGAAFVVMLVTWHPGASLGWVIFAYALVGAGVGLAATPASRALMASVPTSWSGMGSAGLDLTRDFGGAILQAAMGGLLAVSYAASMRADLASLPAQQAAQVSTSISNQLTGSFEGSASVAEAFPQYSKQILAAASTAFTDGKDAAILVALAMSVIGFVLVVTVFPGKKKEDAHYAQVQTDS